MQTAFMARIHAFAVGTVAPCMLGILSLAECTSKSQSDAGKQSLQGGKMASLTTSISLLDG